MHKSEEDNPGWNDMPRERVVNVEKTDSWIKYVTHLIQRVKSISLFILIIKTLTL